MPPQRDTYARPLAHAVHDTLPLHLTTPQLHSSSDKEDVDVELQSVRAYTEAERAAEHLEDAGLLDSGDEQDDDDSRMSRNRTAGARASSREAGPSEGNGHANGNGNGMSGVEYRRRPASIDSTGLKEQTQNLMTREGFSLDHDPPITPRTPGGSLSFYDLPLQDRRNFLLLVLLYFLQGIPMGLAHGSVPFILKPYLSYGQIGVFSLAAYPYSLKLLWSPIVDAIWSPKYGRRKSWIVPIQLLSGLGMIWLSGSVEQMMEDAGKSNNAVWTFTGWWFFLVAMCATQDIAVDGWALTLLSPSNISYASTAQTVGLTAGGFLSHTVFLAFNSKDFANNWFRSVPLDSGLISLSGYLKFWGWGYIVVTIGLAILKQEEKTRDREGVVEVYKVMWDILSLRNVQLFIVLHLIAKIGFQANEAVSSLKLLDKGFSQADMALTVLIDFPFEIALGYYVGKWSGKYQPMRLWCWAFVARLAAALFAHFVVWMFPKGGVNTSYFIAVIGMNIFSISTSTVMFVAVAAFHAKIADPVVGGTYMTLLATVSNLGGTFPKFFILKLIDMFTKATCIPPTSPVKDLKGKLITQAFSCALEADKHICTDGGGECVVQRDGYYITNILCVLIGAVTFWTFIRPTAMKLQALPLKAWRTRG